MRIVTTTVVRWDGVSHPEGTELDVPDELAARWERQGACKPVKRSQPRAVESVKSKPAKPAEE